MFELQTPDYAKKIATQLHLKVTQVGAALSLLDEGNTIPFIARYRKEMTGVLDENQLRDIASRHEVEKNLHQRKCDVIRLLEEQGVLSDESIARPLIGAIIAAHTLTEVDDMYRPYRPKRKTRASVAKEQGLAPLASWLKQPARKADDAATVMAHAVSYIAEEKGVTTADEALQGATDIFAEEVADDAESRKWARKATFDMGQIRSVALNAEAESVYEAYYEYQEPVSAIPPHRILAINRGERQEFLKVSIVAPQDEIVEHLTRRHVDALFFPGNKSRSDFYTYSLLKNAVQDAYKRLISPAVEREVRSALTERAETHAIDVFGENLKSLLLSPPIRGKVVLGVDPAYRTGCKLAVVDGTGKLLEVGVIYPTPPQNKVEEARRTAFRILDQYDVDIISIGNGTASRETEAFIAECSRDFRDKTGRSVPYVIVSEAGASVYSASKLAGEEFPDLDVSERSAISIARRVQDPLAELVKIDPKAVGVGQYQHDVSQKELGEKLATVVETAVNQVGVDVNTASPSLLSYVAGLNKTVAKNIVLYREQNGPFRARAALSKVARLGAKTLEQCVGFLRIVDGDEVLDATPIHPESYRAVNALFKNTGVNKQILRDANARHNWFRQLRAVPLASLCADIGLGEPTLKDILDALERPGRDPREDVPAPILRTDVLKLEDIEVGMVLTGTVRNVVDFGAFVDVGVKNDGLVHISQLADRYVKDPLDVVSVGDVVRVRVIQVDLARQRLGLSMKDVGML